jgi:dihydroxyacetone kinase-like protein
MFTKAAERLREQHAILSELDSIGGDGDHGTTILRVAEQMDSTFEPSSPQSLSALLKSLGWNVMGVDGGASSAIIGTFFGGMGDVEIGDEVDCDNLVIIFEAGLRAVKNQTKAELGDKTMMDALVPAVNAMNSASRAGKDISLTLKEAAIAARSGAESTKALIAKHGRAKFLGERTRGHADAGASSIAILFAGFSAAIRNERNG